MSQKDAAVAMQNAGIWGTATQSLNWAATGNSPSQAWSRFSGAGGFWDEPAPSKPLNVAKQQPPKLATVPMRSTTTNPPQQQQQQQQSPPQNNKTNKSKTKKDDEGVKKPFENNTAKADDFTQWCNRTLSGLQASVDGKLYQVVGIYSPTSIILIIYFLKAKACFRRPKFTGFCGAFLEGK